MVTATVGRQAGGVGRGGGDCAEYGARRAQKNALKPWLKHAWCIPPKENAAFVARMEDLLAVYQRPRDPQRPLICFDEGSTELHDEVRPPQPMGPGHPAREDYEYTRHGTANLFLWSAPLLGQRGVTVTAHRTRVDFAHAIRDLVEVQFSTAERIVLVLDNCNTPDPASRYHAFPPADAKRLWDKLEVHYPPKYGSWLNMAELELAVCQRQCLQQRSGTRRPWHGRHGLGGPPQHRPFLH